MAKKKNFFQKNTGLVIFLGLLLLIGGLFAFGIPQQVSQESLFTSIDTVQIEDEGERIRITGVTNGAERLNIDISEEDLNQELESQGYRAEDGLSGSVRLTEQQVRFTANSQGNDFYRVQNRDLGGFFGIGSCTDLTNYEKAGQIPTSAFDNKQCFYIQNVGQEGEFTTNEPIIDSEVEVTIGGQTETINPSQGENRVDVGGAEVVWTGSLNNFRGVENAPNYDVLFEDGNPTRLIEDGAHSDYQIAQEEFRERINYQGSVFELFTAKTNDLNVAPTPLESTVDDATGFLNERLEDLIENQIPTYNNDISGSASFEGNDLVVDLETATQFPQFIITIDADEVSLVRLEGEPQIQSIADFQVNEGEQTTLDVEVKNVGDEGGQFVISGSCPTATITGESQFVDAGTTSTMTLSVSSGNVDSDTSENCEVNVEDQNSGNTDGGSFSGTITAIEDTVPEEPVISPPENETPSDPVQLDCGFGQKEVTTTKEVGVGPLGIGKLVGATETETINECQNRTWLNIVIIAGVLAVLIGIMVLISRIAGNTPAGRIAKRVTGGRRPRRRRGR